MSENDEKFLSPDKFKEQVYKNIGTLESLDNVAELESEIGSNTGCLGFFMKPLMGRIGRLANKKAREQMKIREWNVKAEDILAERKTRDLICEKLDPTVVLPVDVAYKITPVLYGLALEDEEKVPFNSMLFAIISRKIVEQGVENYCAKKSKKAEKEKRGENEGA